MKLTEKALMTMIAGLIVPLSTPAMPDGRRAVTDIQNATDEEGRPLPVQFLASDRSADEIYIKPLSGRITAREAVLANPKVENFAKTCDEIAMLFDSRRNLRALYARLSERLLVDVTEIIRLEETTKQLFQNRAPLVNQSELYKNEITSLDKQIGEAKTTIETLDSHRLEAKSKLNRAIEANDQALIADLRAELDALLSKIKANERALEDLQVKKSKASNAQMVLLRKMAEIDGQIDATDQALAKLRQRRTATEEEIAKSSQTFETILKSHSSESAGYLKLTMDFAPAQWISQLEAKNPGKTFTYVPSLGATLDVTFPAIKEDSALKNSIGNFILDQKWTNAGEAWMQNPFFKKLVESGMASIDPKSVDFLEKLNELLQAYSDDLSGEKQLTLHLTNFGACALIFPEKYPVDLNPTGSVFALNMYYTYPVKYDIRVHGSHKVTKTLYELYKRSSSSSWLGLSKKQRQEYVRDVTSNEYMNIKVESSSPNFSADDAADIRQQIAEKLAFDAVKDYLDFTKPAPDPNFGDINAARPLNSIGSKMMFFKVNPWVFWGGFALKALDSMFGSSSNTATNRQSFEMGSQVNFTDVFASQHSGSITIGSLEPKELIRR